jgi:hypothetical protein
MTIHKLCIVYGHGGDRLWQGTNMLPSSWTWFTNPSQWAWFDTYGLLFMTCMQSTHHIVQTIGCVLRIM